MKEKQVGGGQMADYYLSELQREVAATDIRHGGQLGVGNRKGLINSIFLCPNIFDAHIDL